MTPLLIELSEPLSTWPTVSAKTSSLKVSKPNPKPRSSAKWGPSTDKVTCIRKRFRQIKKAHLTFHIGAGSRREIYRNIDYVIFNKVQSIRALRRLLKKRGLEDELPWLDRLLLRTNYAKTMRLVATWEKNAAKP